MELKNLNKVIPDMISLSNNPGESKGGETKKGLNATEIAVAPKTLIKKVF